MWNCTHFGHPTDEQLGHVDIFLATTIICSLSTLNSFISIRVLEYSIFEREIINEIMKIEIVQLEYIPYRNQLHTYVYNYFLKVNCFIHHLKVFRSGALLVSSGRDFQVEIAKYLSVWSKSSGGDLRHNKLFNPPEITLTNTNMKQKSSVERCHIVQTLINECEHILDSRVS